VPTEDNSGRSAHPAGDLAAFMVLGDLSLLRLARGDGTADRLRHHGVVIVVAHQLVVAAEKLVVLVDQKVVLVDKLAVLPFAIVVEHKVERRDERLKSRPELLDEQTDLVLCHLVCLWVEWKLRVLAVLHAFQVRRNLGPPFRAEEFIGQLTRARVCAESR
jgi:hypothetical protein